MGVATAAVPTTVELASLPAVAAMAVPAPAGAQPSFHPEPAAAAYTPALPSGGGVDKEVWDCPACTFRNEVPRGPFQMECEVCQTPHEPMTAEERRWLEQEANIEQESLVPPCRSPVHASTYSCAPPPTAVPAPVLLHSRAAIVH